MNREYPRFSANVCARHTPELIQQLEALGFSLYSENTLTYDHVSVDSEMDIMNVINVTEEYPVDALISAATIITMLAPSEAEKALKDFKASLKPTIIK